jgi:hypothetical protein
MLPRNQGFGSIAKRFEAQNDRFLPRKMSLYLAYVPFGAASIIFAELALHQREVSEEEAA